MGDRHLVIVRNPAARSAPDVASLEQGAEPLLGSGWRVDVRETAGPGDAVRLAREAAEAGASVVVAAGGDGTVNEVVNGLAGTTSTALAVIPAGTANIWAKETFTPRHPAGALALAGIGRRVRVDVGLLRAGEIERRFLLMCGVGLDARVVHDVETQRGAAKRRLGRAAFVWPAVRAALGMRPTHATIVLDGEECAASLLLAVAGNTRLYGGLVRLASAARIDDGLLDLVTFADPAPGARGRRLREARLLLRAVRGSLDHARMPGLAYRRARRIEVRPASPLPVQADGEFVAECGPDAPLVLECLPRALEVVLAPRPNPLLGEPA